MSTAKRILRYITVFIITAALLITLLLLAALIPRERIQINMEESAHYLQQKGEAFPYTDFGLSSSIADYYADAVLLNIAYNLDSNHPAESVAWARFYSEDAVNWNGMVTSYLPESVKKQLPANQQYLRYWHGSLSIVRPLLVWFNIGEIYKILGTVIWLLTGSMVILLVRKGFGKEAVAFVLALIMVSVWFVPLCLEFMWMFLVMAIVSLITINLSLKKRYQLMPVLFLCVGMVTVFLDFLTTETITLLIPLMFVLMIQHRQKSGTHDWALAAKSVVLWGTGYIGMWITKWAFAAFVLKRNIAPYLQDNITFHLGLSNRLSMRFSWWTSIRLNVRNLLTFNYGILGTILTLLLFVCLVFLPILLGRTTLKRKIQTQWMILYLIIGMVPYLRYVVLSPHSIEHAWFTYRAQAASIMALILAFYELVDINFKQKLRVNNGKTV